MAEGKTRQVTIPEPPAPGTAVLEQAPRGRQQVHDLVAVAASAGGVGALTVLLASLPAQLPAAVLVALHLPPDGRSMLAQILRRAAPLSVLVAEHGAPLLPGYVYVGNPDSHLLVRGGRVLLGQGPPENGHRPSHDAMLRSVALAAGPRAVGVVLTGLLHDGAAGLAAVARYGGTCLVQDPNDCEFPSMPLAALESVPTARQLPLLELAAGVVRAVWERPLELGTADDPQQRALDLVELHCRTGRAPDRATQREEALRIALGVLQERADLSRRRADAAQGGRDRHRADLDTWAADAERSVALIKRVLAAGPPDEARNDVAP